MGQKKGQKEKPGVKGGRKTGEGALSKVVRTKGVLTRKVNENKRKAEKTGYRNYTLLRDT